VGHPLHSAAPSCTLADEADAKQLALALSRVRDYLGVIPMSASQRALADAHLARHAKVTAAPGRLSVREGFVSIERAGDVQEWPCSLAGASIAAAVIASPSGLPVERWGRPGRVRMAVSRFASFLEGVGARDVAAQVHRITVTARLACMRQATSLDRRA
jgi:hypothetical protein